MQKLQVGEIIYAIFTLQIRRINVYAGIKHSASGRTTETRDVNITFNALKLLPGLRFYCDGKGVF